MAMAVSNQQSRDAALLRATTELFVLEATHDPDEIRRFEELATHFLPRVSAADRAFVAERLSKSKDAPSAILRQLGKDLVEVASPILKRSPALAEFDFLTIMASTGHGHHRLIATRSDLSPLVVAALRLTDDAEVVARVAHYPAVMTESEALAAVDADEVTETTEDIAPPIEPTTAVAEAAAQPEPATLEEAPAAAVASDEAPVSAEAREIFAAVRALASTFEAEERARAPKAALPPAPAMAEPVADTPEITEPVASAPTQQAEASAPTASASHGATAFLDLDRSERLALLQEVASHPAPPRTGTSVIDADHAFRLALGRARLASLARKRQREALIRTLAQGLRLPEIEVTALMDDPSGEALVVLLRGIGLSEDEAQHVLLFANPVVAAGIENFERLARLLAETKESVAAELIASWRTGEVQPKHGHAPLFADLELRRGIMPSAMQQSREAVSHEPPERSVFGLRGR